MQEVKDQSGSLIFRALPIISSYVFGGETSDLSIGKKMSSAFKFCSYPLVILCGDFCDWFIKVGADPAMYSVERLGGKVDSN